MSRASNIVDRAVVLDDVVGEQTISVEVDVLEPAEADSWGCQLLARW